MIEYSVMIEIKAVIMNFELLLLILHMIILNNFQLILIN